MLFFILNKSKIKFIKWPAYSSDLNQIENIKEALNILIINNIFKHIGL